MGASLTEPSTLEEFLAWERRQGLRYEFDGVRAIAMTGGTLNHATITGNLAEAALGRVLSRRRPAAA